MEIRLWVTKLGGQNIILGLPWLKIWNPQINWSTGEMEIPDKPTGWQRMANSFQKAIEINYFRVNNYQTKTRRLVKVKRATMTEEEKEKIAGSQTTVYRQPRFSEDIQCIESLDATEAARIL